MIANLPRLLICGESGTGKSKFAKKLVELHSWQHVDIDLRLSQGDDIFDIVKDIPDENYSVVNWTFLTDDLNLVAETIFNKNYSCLLFRSNERHIEKYLKSEGFDDDFINDEKRKEAEKDALNNLVWLFSNVSRIMINDYFDLEGNFKDDEFVSAIDFYYRGKTR